MQYNESLALIKPPQSDKFPDPWGEYSSSIVAWPPTCSWWTWFSCVCGIVFHFTMLSKEELHTRTIQNWISTAAAALLSCSLDSAASERMSEKCPFCLCFFGEVHKLHHLDYRLARFFTCPKDILDSSVRTKKNWKAKVFWEVLRIHPATGGQTALL